MTASFARMRKRAEMLAGTCEPSASSDRRIKLRAENARGLEMNCVDLRSIERRLDADATPRRNTAAVRRTVRGRRLADVACLGVLARRRQGSRGQHHADDGHDLQGGAQLGAALHCGPAQRIDLGTVTVEIDRTV